MNTMADLRRECAARLRETLHGKEIDTFRNEVNLPHMLGIVPIGAISTYEVERGTLMDSNHEFWQDFHEEVNTDNEAHRRIQSAIRSLIKDDIFRKTYPQGEEADRIYCEVDRMEESDGNNLQTTCANCGEIIDVPLKLQYADGTGYTLNLDVDCPHCSFTRALSANTVRR